MRSSYHFLFAGASEPEKQRLLHSLLFHAGSGVLSSEQGLSLFEMEGLQCSLSMSGDADETVQALLQGASSMVGVVLFVHIKDCSKSSFLMQVELLAALSTPLLAIVVSGVHEGSPEFISEIEQGLFHSLRQGGLLHDDLVVFSHTPEDQNETAKRLFRVLSQRVLYATPPTTKDAGPLQLMLRARRRTINGREFALATLLRGTISVGDKVATNTYHTARVIGLFDAYDLDTLQGSLRAEEEPREIFVALDGYWWNAGELITRCAERPEVRECRVLIYVPTGGAHAIESKGLSQIILSWGGSNQSAAFGLSLHQKKPLQPGSFASATLRDLYGSPFLLQEQFFTWYPPVATRSTKAEGLGRVLASEAK